jgi:hypothetical protein
MIRSTSNYSDYPMGAWAANKETGIRNFIYSLVYLIFFVTEVYSYIAGYRMRPLTHRITRPLTSLVTGVSTPLVKFGQRFSGSCRSTSSTSTAISTHCSLLHPLRTEPYQRATSTGLLSTRALVRESPSYPSTVTPSSFSKSHSLLLGDYDLTVRDQARFERDEASAMSPLVL